MSLFVHVLYYIHHELYYRINLIRYIFDKIESWFSRYRIDHKLDCVSSGIWCLNNVLPILLLMYWFAPIKFFDSLLLTNQCISIKNDEELHGKRADENSVSNSAQLLDPTISCCKDSMQVVPLVMIVSNVLFNFFSFF